MYAEFDLGPIYEHRLKPGYSPSHVRMKHVSHIDRLRAQRIESNPERQKKYAQFNEFNHDIRNPISMFLGYVRIADQVLIEDHKSSLQQMDQAIDLSLLQDLVALATASISPTGSLNFVLSGYGLKQRPGYQTLERIDRQTNRLKTSAFPPQRLLMSLDQPRPKRDNYRKLLIEKAKRIQNTTITAFIQDPSPKSGAEIKDYFTALFIALDTQISHLTNVTLPLLRNFAQSLNHPDETLNTCLDQMASLFPALSAKLTYQLTLVNLDLEDFKANWQHLSLTELINSFILFHQQRITEKNIAITTMSELKDDLHCHIRTEDALQNILANALKYTPAGGKIRVSRQDLDHHSVICIADTGQGIEKTDIGLIFEVGRQGKNAVPSSGLGLANVRRIVKEQGGIVGVDSEPGKGSAFYVILANEPDAQPLEERQLEEVRKWVTQRRIELLDKTSPT